MYKIIEKKYIGPDIWQMKVLAPRVARYAMPGQFVIVITDKKGERIPLTICDFNRKEGWVVIVLQVVGFSTGRMAALNEGDAFADFVGPLGQPSLFINEEKEELKEKKFIFVAGGVGAAPVYPQLKWLSENGVTADIILGARSKEQLILLDDLKKVSDNIYVATNDGSEGTKGFVTDVLKTLIEDKPGYYKECIAIGPMIMMKSVAEMTKGYGLRTVVSLNTLMIDGTGMCGACRVTVGGKVKFTCVDGPEFDGHQVNFEEAMRRQGMYRKEESESHRCNIDEAVEASHKNNKR